LTEAFGGEDTGDYDEYGWLQDFINIFRPYIEGQDTDDIDRINRQEEADAFMDILRGVLNGTVDPDELRNFESDYLSEIPGWNDYFQGVLGSLDSGETQEPTEAAEEDQGFLESVYNKLPQDMRDFIDDLGEDPLKVVKRILDSMPDLTDQFKRGQIGVEIIFGDWKKNSNVFGPFVIPGVPLPPGIIDITFEDIEKIVKETGGTVRDFIEDIKNDPLGTIEEIGKTIIGKVEEVFGGVADDPGWGGSIGGFGDWINGIFGSVLGGTILGTIYDQVSGYFEDGTPPIPGGEEEETADVVEDTTADVAEDTTADTAADFTDTTADDEEGLGFTGTPDDSDADIIVGSFDEESPDVPGGTPDSSVAGGGGASVGGTGTGEFSPFMGMFNYAAQAVPGVATTGPVDYTAELNQEVDALIMRSLARRGMFT
jgi:hypothetical protein